MSEKTADINWLRGFLQYFVPKNKRVPTPRHAAIYSCGSFRRGATPGAFGNPKPHQSFDSRITNNMRVHILQEKAKVNEA